jgi:hypothetical protein
MIFMAWFPFQSAVRLKRTHGARVNRFMPDGVVPPTALTGRHGIKLCANRGVEPQRAESAGTFAVDRSAPENRPNGLINL